MEKPLNGDGFGDTTGKAFDIEIEEECDCDDEEETHVKMNPMVQW